MAVRTIDKRQFLARMGSRRDQQQQQQQQQQQDVIYTSRAMLATARPSCYHLLVVYCS